MNISTLIGIHTEPQSDNGGNKMFRLTGIEADQPGLGNESDPDAEVLVTLDLDPVGVTGEFQASGIWLDMSRPQLRELIEALERVEASLA